MKKNGLLQHIFLRFFENSRDELGTGNTRHSKHSLRYTMIISKFTQGNLGAKKIARSRFQSSVKKKNRKFQHWQPTARSPILFDGVIERYCKADDSDCGLDKKNTYQSRFGRNVHYVAAEP